MHTELLELLRTGKILNSKETAKFGTVVLTESVLGEIPAFLGGLHLVVFPAEKGYVCHQLRNLKPEGLDNYLWLNTWYPVNYPYTKSENFCLLTKGVCGWEAYHNKPHKIIYVGPHETPEGYLVEFSILDDEFGVEYTFYVREDQ